MVSLVPVFGLLSLALVASSLDQAPSVNAPVAQSPIVQSSVKSPAIHSAFQQSPEVQSAFVQVQPQQIPVELQLPSLVLSEGIEFSDLANSPVYLKEFSMTDHLFPSLKKIGGAFSSGASKVRSFLPGNPFKKWSGRSDNVEIVEEIPLQVLINKAPIPIKFNSELPKQLLSKAAAAGQAKLSQLAAKSKGKLSGPGSLEASVKVQHPIVGKQSAKIKLSTIDKH